MAYKRLKLDAVDPETGEKRSILQMSGDEIDAAVDHFMLQICTEELFNKLKDCGAMTEANN